MNSEICFTNRTDRDVRLYTFLTLMLALNLSMAGLACDRVHPTEALPTFSPSQASPDDQDGHDHGDESSDLDRPVDELIAQTCEHEMKAYECDECRYEVGFVRAPAALFEGGLLSTTQGELRKVELPLALTGEIRFDERRIGHVSTQVEGVLRQVHVALGDQVKKGQPLLEIESAAIGEGQAAYLEAEGMLALARRSFERISKLHTEAISSEKEYLQAKQELEAAEIRAAAALAKLNHLGTGAAGGGRIVLRAPLDGTVLEMHAVSGEVAKTEEPLLTVSDSTAVWVWADLYERDLAAVKKGQAAQKLTAAISVKAYPGEAFPGVVDLISPAMDEASRTAKARIQVENGDGRLLAGMFAAIQVFLPGAEEVLALPRQAVLEDEGRAFVFVHHGADDYVRRPVHTGRRWADWVEIEAGLDPSQIVVAEGAFLMKSDVLRSKMGAGCAD